jgi:hypothetical protein
VVEAEVQAPPQLGLVDLVEAEQDLMFRDQLSRQLVEPKTPVVVEVEVLNPQGEHPVDPEW